MDVNAVKLMNRTIMTVRVTHLKELKIRLHIACFLIKAAAWITGMGINIEIDKGA